MASGGENIGRDFPGLHGTDWQITSPWDKRYNCIAWAAGDNTRWWWPMDESYWPDTADRLETVAAFVAAFASLGFELCSEATHETHFDKIVIFADADGIPTHAARQLSDGQWTSKLGRSEDITHALTDICGEAYGSVAQVMRRVKMQMAEPTV